MYDESFYATSRGGMIGSATALVPQLLTLCEHPRRVIDVGCGEGWWAKEFESHGSEVIGIDGGWHGEHQLGERFIPHDLANPLPVGLKGDFDAVVCLEVAEHLRPARARTFIQDLCNLTEGYVIFSAAVPGQGGTGHLNEQWPDYWAELFNEAGFAINSTFRLDIWADDRIENWYRQNLLIAFPHDEPTYIPPPLRLVHPILYDARRKR
jgi:SAM-dependent methyltransferase